MTTSLRQLEIMLICEICDGEVDLSGDSDTAQCRHCGIAFAVDAPMAAELRRGA